jgi:hypothetical protein
MVIALTGASLCCLRPQLAGGSTLGYSAAIVAVSANAVAAVLGRGLNRTGRLSPLLITTLSIGPGTLVLLGAGLAPQGLPALRPA